MVTDMSPVPPGEKEAIAGTGRHLGDLTRGEETWQVRLETRNHGQLVAGRVHFNGPRTTRVTSWIFLEWSEQDVIARFNEFSPVELWKLLESLE